MEVMSDEKAREMFDISIAFVDTPDSDEVISFICDDLF